MKKLNKFFAVLVALAMMATLCVMSAFAADPVKSTNPALAVLTKDFQVPAGVTTPAAEFAYDFDLQSKPTSATATDTTGTITITPTTGDTGDKTGLLYLKDVFKYGDDAKLVTTGENKSMLDQPGEYVFLVTENEANSSFTSVDATNATEAIDYSKAAYTLRVYVARDTDGNLYVKDITVQETTVTPGEEGQDPTIVYGDKVNPDDQTKPYDPTPDQPNSGDETTIPAGIGSDFAYTNTYSKTLKDDPGDNDDPSLQNAAVAIDKTVTGSGDTNYQFPFTVNITLPEEMIDAEHAQTFTATYPNGTVTLTVPAGARSATEAQPFTLKNGEALKFATFPAGATLTVYENVAGSAVQNKALYYGSATGLGEGATYAKNAALNYTTAAVDDQGKVAVTNTLDAGDITPTGILISNLPYIALALVAIGGLVAYVVVRRRNEDEA